MSPYTVMSYVILNTRQPNFTYTVSRACANIYYIQLWRLVGGGLALYSCSQLCMLLACIYNINFLLNSIIFFAVHLVGSLSLANNVQHSASIGGCCNDGHLIMPCHQHIHTILIHAAARALPSLLVSNCCRSMYIPSHHIYFVYSQSKYASYTIPGSTLKLPTFNSSCI